MNSQKEKITDKTNTTFKGVLQSDVDNGAVSQEDADKFICDYFSISENEYNYLKEYINGNT